MEAERQADSKLFANDWNLLVHARWFTVAGIGGYLCFIPFQTKPDLATFLLVSFGLLAVCWQVNLRLTLRRIDYFAPTLLLSAATLSAVFSNEALRGLDYLIYLLINTIILLMAASLTTRRAVKAVAVVIGFFGMAHLFVLIFASHIHGIDSAQTIVNQAGLATLVVPNDALILGLCFPALAWVLLDSSGRWRLSAKMALIVYALLSLAICHALLSKVALLSLLAAIGSVAFFSIRIPTFSKGRRKLLSGLGPPFGFLLLSAGLAWFLGNQSTVRLSLWNEALFAHSSFKEFLAGAGPLTFLFNPSSTSSMFDKGDLIIPWVHNVYLETWHDLGIAGLLALLAMTFLPIVRALRIRDQGMRMLVLASMMAFIVAAVFEVTLTRRFYFAFLTIFYGLAVGHATESRNERSD